MASRQSWIRLFMAIFLSNGTDGNSRHSQKGKKISRKRKLLSEKMVSWGKGMPMRNLWDRAAGIWKKIPGMDLLIQEMKETAFPIWEKSS